MRRKQIAVVLLSAVLSISVCLPVGSLPAFAAENESTQEAAAVEAENAPPEEKSQQSAEVSDESGNEIADTTASGAGKTEDEVNAADTSDAASATEEESSSEEDHDFPEDSTSGLIPEDIGSESLSEGKGEEDEAEAVTEQADLSTDAMDQETAVPAVPEPVEVPAETEIMTKDAANANAEDNNLRVYGDNPDNKDLSEKYVSPGEVVELKVTVTAVDTSQLNYSWYCTRGSSQKDIEGRDLAVFKTNPIVDNTCYRCTVTDQYGNEDYTYFDIYVNNHLEAYPDGSSTSEGFIYASPGESVELKVNATADDTSQLEYTWYKYESKYHEERIEGADSDVCKIDSISSPRRHRHQYRCYVRDQYGNSDYVWFSIYVEALEARADGIRDFYVTLGQAAELKVNTMAPENSRLKYTWYEGDVDEGTIIEGADSDVYKIDSVMKSSPYSCKVEDLNGNRSKTVEFNVYVDNKLEAYVDGTKDDQVIIMATAGEEADLKVSAAAADSSQLKYIWYKGDYTWPEYVIEGADSASYRISSVPDNNCRYICEVSDQYGNNIEVYFDVNTFYADENGNLETYLYVSPGDTAELKVFTNSADSNQLKYTWSVNTGVWEDEHEQYEEIKGAEGDVYRIDSVSENHSYNCKVYDPSSDSYTWLSYNVIIDNQLKVYAYGTKKTEADTYVPYGESAELKVSATAADSSQLTYVWYKDYEDDDNIIEGAASSVAKTDPISQNDKYICIVTDQYGNSQKVEFSVHVDNKLEAYVDGTKETSAYMTVTPGETVDLKVSASALDADHLRYEWRSCEYNDFEEFGADYLYGEIKGSNTPILKNVAVRNYRRDLYCDVSDPYGNEVRIYFHINSLKNSDPIEVFCDDVVRTRILPYPQSDAIYKFTPPETAEYIFYFTDGFWSNSLDLLDEQMHNIGEITRDGDRFDNYLKTTLEAGKMYYLIVFDKKQYYDNYGVRETNMHIELFTGASPLTIEAQDISISASEFVYDGKAKTPAVTVSHDGTVLKEGTDYEVSYRNNINAGTATVTVTGIGNYNGTNSVTFLIKAVGWIQENGEWFYYNNNGSKLVNGWAKDSTGWCWMDASGKITKNKWILSGGQWYYLKPNGYMAANEWAKDSTGWCWMDASGKITKNKWILSGGQWYYLKANGYMAANEWAKDSGGWYWMDASGKITKNKWILSGGQWYYLKANGYMAANEWARDSGGWYWMDASGKITKNKWIQTGGKWYYLGANGYMVTGTQKIGGKTYKFNSSGVWIQ